MRTREAKYADVGPVFKYLKANHEATGWDIIPINDKTLRISIVSMIRTQEIADVLIAEEDGEIRGVLLATMDNFFWAKEPYASDVHFIATGGGPALLNKFKDWAQRRKCKCIVMAIATMDSRAEMFLKVSGFERRGGALVCWLDKPAQEQAA